MYDREERKRGEEWSLNERSYSRTTEINPVVTPQMREVFDGTKDGWLESRGRKGQKRERRLKRGKRGL